MSKPAQFLLVFETAWANLITFNLDLWAVYYLISINITNYIFIAGFEGLFFVPGPLIMESLISYWPAKKRVITSTFCFMNLLVSIYFILVDEGSESYPHYLIIFFSLNFFAGAITSRQNGETVETVRHNVLLKMVIINTILLLKELFSALFFLILGYSMEKSNRSFIYSVAIINGVLLILHITRRILE